jgi:hypothetical protein
MADAKTLPEVNPILALDSEGDLNERSTIRYSIKFLWAPVLHFVCCILLVLCMVYFLQGYRAVLPPSPRMISGHLKLRVSDVTTIVSTALTLIKIIVSAWTGIIIWNCVFILLEKLGLSLDEIQRILTFSIPPFQKSGSVLLVGMLLILVIPQQLISPLLSGALDWGYGFEFGAKPTLVQAGDSSASPLAWYWYYYSTRNRQASVRRAAAYASIAWDNSTTDRNHCRHIMNDVGIPINSSAVDVVIPCIQIHSITFPSSPPSTGVYNLIHNSIMNTGNDTLSRVEDAPFSYDNDGNAVLFDINDRPSLFGEFPPQGYFEMDVPSRYIQSGLMTVAIIINGTVPLNGKNCTDLKENVFGLTNYNNIFSPVQNGNYYHCFTYAVVNLTAGITISPTSTYISSRVIEADISDSQMEFLPGPWVHEAMYLMPDVMSTFTMMNSTPLATWDSLESYIAKLIRYSYQGTWDMLSRSFEPNTSQVTVELFEQRQVAQVSHKRVYAWLAIGLLLQISCVVLILGSRALRRDNVLDGTIAALLTDPTALLEKMGRGLRDPSFVTPAMNKEVGTLLLQRTSHESYHLLPMES